MSKIKRITIKSKRRTQTPGSSPGIVELTENAVAPKITIYSYNQKDFFADEVKDVKELDSFLNKHEGLTRWIDIKGLGSLELFEYIEGKFGIHKLVLEDIVSTDQRPKLDEYKNYLFAISRMLYIND